MSLFQSTPCVCPSAGVSVCVVYGHTMGLGGQFLENHLLDSNRHWQQLDLAFPCLLPDVANLCPRPKLCRMAWVPVARPLGRPLPMPLAQLATLAKEPGWSLGPLVVL